MVRFHTDADEYHSPAALAGTMADLFEDQGFPGGIVGFHLYYVEQDCATT